MLPNIVLVGRPNVGKSTLFNRLTGGRTALVADVPGLTRDRRYQRTLIDGRPCIVVDTGGLFGDHAFAAQISRQADVALYEADLVLFLVDARDGTTPLDLDIAMRLRRTGKPVLLVVNKTDGVAEAFVASEFAGLAFDDQYPVSLAHNHGVATLVDAVARHLPEAAEPEPVADGVIRCAIVGRPNVGKSTLVNRLLGEERQLVYDEPGTTRDAIEIAFRHGGRDFELIDTAGVRRKGRVEEVVEKFSIVKSLDAIERAHVVVVVLDAREGLVEQDLHVLQYALEAGSGVVVAVNKWDGLSHDDKLARRTTLDRRLDFIPWAPVRFISALHGSGVGHLLDEVAEVYDAGAFEVATSLLNRVFEGLIAAHPPPAARGRPIKLRYAHKAGDHPPRIAVHGNQVEALPASYVRYLENGFREAFDLVGNPVQLELKSGVTPYAGRRNVLTPRQERRRKRVRRHRR
jgi:GTP-binding protein